MGMKPVALFSAREVSLALNVTQPRFARAIWSGKVRPDFVANGARGIDLFLPASRSALRLV
jgi:hypothetical protein